PAAWPSRLTHILARLALDVARQRARRATDAQPPEVLLGHRDAAPRSDPARMMEVNVQMQALARVLGTMEPELRSCWTLREIDGMPYREVATALDITESTARGRIARARTHVIDHMKEWR
ncbi:MAG: RNA polymerase sigma factor, partial [Dietzia sp.]